LVKNLSIYLFIDLSLHHSQSDFQFLNSRLKSAGLN
jgi:hypothetical protein